MCAPAGVNITAELGPAASWLLNNLGPLKKWAFENPNVLGGLAVLGQTFFGDGTFIANLTAAVPGSELYDMVSAAVPCHHPERPAAKDSACVCCQLLLCPGATADTPWCSPPSRCARAAWTSGLRAPPPHHLPAPPQAQVSPIYYAVTYILKLLDLFLPPELKNPAAEEIAYVAAVNSKPDPINNVPPGRLWLMLNGTIPFRAVRA